MEKLKPYNNILKNDHGPKISDIFIVLSISFVLVAIVYFVSVSYSNSKLTLRIFRLGSSMIFLCIPIYWCRIKYGQKLRDLGFVKGDYSIATFLIVGIVVAAVYTIILKLLPTWKASAFNEFLIQDNLLYVLLLPISIDGFLYIILGPLSEETMFRGFLYGILRKKYGFVIAMMAQTILFGLFHVDFFKGQIVSQLIVRMIPGIIFVVLVEKFNSILPAIICHSFINYFLIILSMSI